jgi:predicted transcriptional regulator
MEQKNVHHKRMLLRLSQTRLAALSKVSRFKICLYERGDLSLTPHELLQIDEAIREEARRIHSKAGEILARPQYETPR